MNRKSSMRKKILALAEQESETNKRLKERDGLVLATHREKSTANDNRSQ